MTITSGDILKLVVDYVYPGAGTALNIFYHVFAGTDEDDQDVLDAIADWVGVDWGDNWAPLSTTTAELNSVAVQIVDGLGVVLRDVGTEQIDRAGATGNEVSPAAVSAYIQADTDLPQVRGSKYIPAISEGVIEQGVLSAAGLLELGLLLVDYFSPIPVSPGNNLFPGVISVKAAGFKAFQTSGNLNGVPAYQRRRKIGVGS